jgi:hypothetical protein
MPVRHRDHSPLARLSEPDDVTAPVPERPALGTLAPYVNGNQQSISFILQQSVAAEPEGIHHVRRL